MAKAPLNPLQPERVAVHNQTQYCCPKHSNNESAHLEAGRAPGKQKRNKGADPIEQASKPEPFLMWKHHSVVFIHLRRHLAFYCRPSARQG